jgi:hypothetical protein
MNELQIGQRVIHTPTGDTGTIIDVYVPSFTWSDVWWLIEFDDGDIEGIPAEYLKVQS